MAVTPKIRRSYKGAPVEAQTSAEVALATTTSVTLSTSPSSWPTGKFFIVIAPGTAKEEKMCVTLSGNTLTVVDPNVSSTSASANGRGVDDTTAKTNIPIGSVVYPVATARDFDEANSLTSTYANQGGIVYMGDPSFTQLGIGTADQVLKVNSGATAPEWGQVGTNGIADGAVTSGKIANATITNEDVSASAAIALSKLANVTAGQVVLGNASNVPTGTALSGDVTVNSSGVTAIEAGVIVNADINASAAIADTKLATISTADKVSVAALNIDGATDIGADLADADLVIVDDGAGGTNRKSAISRFAKYLFGKVSGDITVTEAGVATTKNWTTWTVTFSNITQTSYTARYIQLGKTVHFFLSVTLGSGGISSSAHSMSLPVAAQSQNALTGLNAIIYDNTASRYLCTTVGLTTSSIGLLYQSGLLGECSQVDGSNPIDTQTGDQIIIHGTYEAA